jgi:hypothetical protein
MGGDPGALAQLSSEAPSAATSSRFDDGAIGERHVDTIGAWIEARNRRGAEINSLRLGAHHQRVDQMTVFDHVRKGSPGSTRPARSGHRTGRSSSLGR